MRCGWAEHSRPRKASQALLACCARHGTVLVEDDIYGDLAWDDSRPPPLRRWDDGGAVITCSSFSKTLSPGLRVGWMLGGAWTGELLRAKYFSTVGNAALPQLAISDYLARHDLERHLRKLRRALAGNASRMRDAIDRHWPAGTRMGEPRGGLSLWIQLPAGSDAAVFSRAALAQCPAMYFQTMAITATMCGSVAACPLTRRSKRPCTASVCLLHA